VLTLIVYKYGILNVFSDEGNAVYLPNGDMLHACFTSALLESDGLSSCTERLCYTLEISLSRWIGQRKESSCSCWDSNASGALCVFMCVCVCSLLLLRSNSHGSSF